MRRQATQSELRAIRQSVDWVGRMSDSLIRIGPFSVGIDGVLSWIPGLGELYSTVAGGFLIVQGYRAGAPLATLIKAAAMLGLRTTASAVPIAGAAFADVFTAHKWTARMIVKAIDRQLSEDAPVQRRADWTAWRKWPSPV